MGLETHGARNIYFVWTLHIAASPLDLSPLPHSWCLNTVLSGLSLWGPLAFTSGVVGLQVCTMSSYVCGTGLKPMVWRLPCRHAFYQPLGFFLCQLKGSRGATQANVLGHTWCAGRGVVLWGLEGITNSGEDNQV